MNKKVLTIVLISFIGVFINNIISTDNTFNEVLNILALVVSIVTLASIFKRNKKIDTRGYNRPLQKRTHYYLHLIIKLVPFILVFGFIIGSASMNYMNKQSYTITVTDTQVKRSGDSDHYLVFTKTNSGENIVFENTDLLFIGKYNSSDIQAKLEKNKTYTISTLGYRIPFFSSYQNIISADKLN